MTGFVVTGHGSFAKGLADAVEMIAGPQQGFSAVTFLEAEAASFPQRLSDAISRAALPGDGAVVFCDLLGGTPFNQAMLIAQSVPGVEVVTGANVPMLLECVSSRDGSSVDELVETAVSMGRMGVDHRKLVVADDEPEGDEGI